MTPEECAAFMRRWVAERNADGYTLAGLRALVRAGVVDGAPAEEVLEVLAAHAELGRKFKPGAPRQVDPGALRARVKEWYDDGRCRSWNDACGRTGRELRCCAGTVRKYTRSLRRLWKKKKMRDVSP